MIIDKIEDLLRKQLRDNDRHTNTIRILLKKKGEASVNSKDLHLTYEWKMDDDLGKLIKLKIFFDKISDSMKGIQIQYDYKQNKNMETYSHKTEYFCIIFLIKLW